MKKQKDVASQSRSKTKPKSDKTKPSSKTKARRVSPVARRDEPDEELRQIQKQADALVRQTTNILKKDKEFPMPKDFEIRARQKGGSDYMINVLMDYTAHVLGKGHSGEQKASRKVKRKAKSKS